MTKELQTIVFEFPSPQSINQSIDDHFSGWPNNNPGKLHNQHGRLTLALFHRFVVFFCLKELICTVQLRIFLYHVFLRGKTVFCLVWFNIQILPFRCRLEAVLLFLPPLLTTKGESLTIYSFHPTLPKQAKSTQDLGWNLNDYPLR